MSDIDQARADAADYYLTAAICELEKAAPDGATVAHLRRAAHQLLSGDADQHPFITHAMSKLSPPRNPLSFARPTHGAGLTTGPVPLED